MLRLPCWLGTLKHCPPLMPLARADKGRHKQWVSGISLKPGSSLQSVLTHSAVCWCVQYKDFSEAWLPKISVRKPEARWTCFLSSDAVSPLEILTQTPILKESLACCSVCVCVCVCVCTGWQVTPAHSGIGPLTFGHLGAHQNQVSLMSP